MTLAGKKLQILYDQGTEEISKLEKTTINNLDETSKKHSQARESEAETDSKQLEDRAKELEGEITQSMDSSFSKLEELKNEQIEKCRIHTETLSEELNKIGDTIRLTLNTLIESMKDQLNDVNEELAHDFDLSIDKSETMLEKQNFESTRAIHGHGSSATNKLQVKLDQNVWESRGSEKQAVSTLYKSYMQKANSIEGHFSNLMKKLSTEYQEQFKTVETAIEEVDSELTDNCENVINNLEATTSEIEREINSFFGDRLTDSSSHLDEKLSEMANEITNTHSVLTLNLEQKTSDLSSGLMTASSAAQEKLKLFAQETTLRADQLHTDFETRMDKKVENSNLIRKELEKAKEDCINEIKDELISIREEFQENLLQLAKQAEDEIFTATETVERDINAAHTRCSNKLDEDSKNAREEIERKIQALLDQISDHRQSALDEIAQAASATQRT